MMPTGQFRQRSLLAVVALALLPGLLAVALPVGTPHPELVAPAGKVVVPEATLSAGPVFAMTLPSEEPHVPNGPNRAQFTASCRLCHSPKLVMTQPPLTEKKWGEVVHKMVAVYGAPIPPDQERNIVTYLTSIRGR